MCSASAPRAPAPESAPKQPRLLLSRRQFSDLMINPAPAAPSGGAPASQPPISFGGNGAVAGGLRIAR